MNILATLWKNPKALKSNFNSIKSCLKGTIKWFDELQKLMLEILHISYLCLNTRKKYTEIQTFQKQEGNIICIRKGITQLRSFYYILNY